MMALNVQKLLREQAVTALAARTALKRLDVRVSNLQDDLPDLVARYRKTREIVDAGHGPKHDGQGYLKAFVQGFW